MNIDALKRAVQEGRFIISRHAYRRMSQRGLQLSDLLLAMEAAEVVEYAPETQGYPLPTWLLLGWLPSGEPVHMLWAFDEEVGEAVLVTTYRPNPDRWIDYRRRR